MSDRGGYVLYRYNPSVVGAAIFTVLFTASSALHTVQIFRKRTWSFIPLLIGGLFESIGYIGRILSHSDKEALTPFIIQSILLLVAPALFAASIYMILGRLISLLDAEEYSVVRVRWLTKVFVAGDVFSFLLQSSGGGMMASGDGSNTGMGEKLIVIGLFVQIAFFGFFVIASILFHKRIHNRPTYASQSLKSESTSLKTSWEGLLYALYVSSAAILIRSIFRVIEYLQGNEGYLMRNEIWLYLFDAVLMLVVMVIFNWIHPSGVIAQKGRSIDRDQEEGMEMARS